MSDMVEMGRRWQKAWTSHRSDTNNCVGVSFGELTDEIERLRAINAELVAALEQTPRTVERLLTEWGKRDSLSDMLDEITAEVHAAIARAKP